MKYEMNESRIYSTFNCGELNHRLINGEKIKGIFFNTESQLFEKLNSLNLGVSENYIVYNLSEVRQMSETPFYMTKTEWADNSIFFYDLSDPLKSNNYSDL